MFKHLAYRCYPHFPFISIISMSSGVAGVALLPHVWHVGVFGCVSALCWAVRLWHVRCVAQNVDDFLVLYNTIFNIEYITKISPDRAVEKEKEMQPCRLHISTTYNNRSYTMLHITSCTNIMVSQMLLFAPQPPLLHADTHSFAQFMKRTFLFVKAVGSIKPKASC